MRIFISHSNIDVKIARILVNLLLRALRLSDDDIRCTSVDGYRMPSGVPINQALRDEVHSSDLVIGLITLNSIKSLYVSFELGARWGADKPMIPLLASGFTVRHLEGPLTGINAITLDSDSSVDKLLEDSMHYLNIQLSRRTTYGELIRELVQASNESKVDMEDQPPVVDHSHFSEDAKELLIAGAKDPYGTIHKIRVLNGLVIKTNNWSSGEVGNRRAEARWEGALNDLVEIGFVGVRLLNGSEVFEVTREGYTAADGFDDSRAP